MARATKQNHITSPDLIKKINPKNLKFTKEFLRYMKSMKRSPGTIHGYENDLMIFWVFLLQECDNKCILDCNIRDFVNFQSYLSEDNENSPARIRRIKSSISSLSNTIELLYSDEYPEFRNLIRKVESPANIPVRKKTIVTQEQIEHLLNVLLKRGDVEKACCFALATYSGRRKAEIFRFKMSDFTEERIVFGTFYKSEPIKSKGRAGGKYISCYVLKRQFQPYLDAWVKFREENGIESEWLFPDPNDPKEHRNAEIMNSWAKTASKITGEDIYPHMFRHNFVSYLMGLGLPSQVVVAIMQWEKSSGDAMLAIYNDADAEDEFSDYFKDGEIIAPQKTDLRSL